MAKSKKFTKTFGKKFGETLRKSSHSKSYKKTRAGVLGAIGVLTPIKVPTSKNKVKRRKVGRPRGTYKHYIPGVGPVHVYEYRKWVRKQKALARLAYRKEIEFEKRGAPVQRAPREYYEREMAEPQPQEIQPIQQHVRNILNAPNIFAGELRRVGANSPIKNMDNINKPITNPKGDYYTVVDPMSGKEVLRRRIREKWES